MNFLKEYTGPWTEVEVRHLLRRTTFGLDETTVKECVALGLVRSIEKLLDPKFEMRHDHPKMENRGPLKYFPEGPFDKRKGVHNDRAAKQGYSWAGHGVFKDTPPDGNVGTNGERSRFVKTHRRASLKYWVFVKMGESNFNIRMKMSLFFSNHFACSNALEYRAFDYFDLIIRNSLENHRELARKMSLNLAMVLYLDTNSNVKGNPNENYARELLELFTIGKGKSLGEGDYSNYTEEDISQLARCFTGWRHLVSNSEASFMRQRHEYGEKKFSSYFNNTIIGDNTVSNAIHDDPNGEKGKKELDDAIDMIFEQKETANFLARNLYQWFVNPNISDDIELNIIKPLGTIIYNDDYEILSALKVLFSSKHFYEINRCMIKSPVDFVFSTVKALQIGIPKARFSDLKTLKEQYVYAGKLASKCSELEQSLLSPPDVAGWEAYYRSMYDKAWINSHLIALRIKFGQALIFNKTFTTFDSHIILDRVDVFKIIESIEESIDPNMLIKGLVKRFFNYPLNENKSNDLKNILIPGLPDNEWKMEYSRYLKTPGDVATKMAVETKLKALISAMMQMPEFQIM